MSDQSKNLHADGLWWKRFLYTATGATGDFELGPNWFASVMGTGIIANAAASLPLISDRLHGFALLVWCLASLMLLGLVAATFVLLIQKRSIWQKHFHDPMMAQFYGAPPMAFLTVAGGTLLLGGELIGQDLAQKIAWLLWGMGTISGLFTAIVIPYRLFTKFTVRPDSAFGGWLMPIVPPMVSAAIGALLVPYAPEGALRETMFFTCFSLFGLSLLPALIVISMIWSRLAHHGTSGTSRVPTLWIVLGPLGQSVTAVGILGSVAKGAVSPELASAFEMFAVFFGVPVFGFIFLWTWLAAFLTIHAIKRQMKFALTYWAFTFPVGTCVTGISQLAFHTELAMFKWASIIYYVGLLLAWCLAAFGTTKGMITGHLFHPPKAGKIVSVKDT